jgi:hypothetical protein
VLEAADGGAVDALEGIGLGVMLVGDTDGVSVTWNGDVVGDNEGTSDVIIDGIAEGNGLGIKVGGVDEEQVTGEVEKDSVGDKDGCKLGSSVDDGATEGGTVGITDGSTEGCVVGSVDGLPEGAMLAALLGSVVGLDDCVATGVVVVGTIIGGCEGVSDDVSVGKRLGMIVGATDGDIVGTCVGL